MLELLEILAGGASFVGNVGSSVAELGQSATTTKPNTPEARTTLDTHTHLQNACRSKLDLNNLKKEQIEKQAKLEAEQKELEAKLQDEKNAVKSDKNYSRGVLRDKGDEQKLREAEIKNIEEQLKRKKQELKDYKIDSKEAIKEKGKQHETNVIDALSAVKSEKNLQDTNPLSAHQAAYIGDSALFNQVNKSVSLTNKIDGVSESVLHAAVMGGNQAVILKLAEKGADFGAKNNKGQTPLHLAAQNPNHNIKTWGEWAKGKEASHRDIDNVIDVIPELSPVLDIPDNEGKTALHYAAERGDLKTVEALVNKGADPNALDSQGKSPLDYVPEKDGKLKGTLEKAKTKYAERISDIANIEQTKTKGIEIAGQLSDKKTAAGQAQRDIDNANTEIKETKAKLELIKKKQGYIGQISSLDKPEEMKVGEWTVDVGKKEELGDSLKELTQKNGTLDQAKEEVKKREKEQESLPKEIDAAQKRIEKKAEYERDLEQLKKDRQALKDTPTEVKKRADALEKFNKREKKLNEQINAITDTPESKAALEASLATLNEGEGQEGSLAQAQKQQREAQEAIDLTNAKLKAIDQKEKLEAKIAELEAKHNEIEIDVTDVEPQTLDAKKAQLNDTLEKLNGGQEVEGSLKQVKATKAQLDIDIKEKQKELDEQNKKITRIQEIIKGDPSGELKKQAASKLLNACIAAGDKEKVEAALQSVAAMTEGPERTEALAKFNVADNAGRTPLSYAMEKGLHKEVEVISKPLREAYEAAQEKHSEQRGKVNDNQVELDLAQKELVNATKLADSKGVTGEDKTTGLQPYVNNIARLEALKAEEALKLQEQQEKLEAATKAYNPPDKMGRTPLSYAMEQGNHEEMKVVYEPLKKEHKEARDKAEELRETDEKNNKAVLKAQEDLTEAKNRGEVAVDDPPTPSVEKLEETLKEAKEKQKEDALKLEEAEKALVVARDALNPADNNGKTHLDYAIEGGNSKAAAELYDHTELHMKAGKAKGFGDTEVEITEENKDAQNINGETPIHIAAKAANKEMVDALLSKGVDLSLQNIEGDTPLHVAVQNGNLEITESLAKNSPSSLTIAGKDGLTPLEMAAMDKENGAKLLESLLKHSGDKVNLLTAKYKDGKTLAEIAIEQGNVEVLESIKAVDGTGITEEQLAAAKKKRDEIEEEKAKEEERRKQAEIAAAEKSGLTEEQKAQMAGSAPTKDGQQRSDATGQTPIDHQGKVWKEENFKNDGGVKTCTIGDTSQGHFKQTRTADGKFEYEVQNTGKDEPDRIQVLKVPREGSNPKSFDVVKFDREGNVVDYQEGKGGKSKIGPETMKKIQAHEESLSRAEVSSEKAKPTVEKKPEKDGPELTPPPPPPEPDEKKNPMEIPAYDKTKNPEAKAKDRDRVKNMRDALGKGGTTIGGSTITAPSNIMNKGKDKKASREI